jgi:hypothetical protein
MKVAWFLLLLAAIFTLPVNAQDESSFTPPVFKERVINLEFFSPLTGNLAFGYEQALKKNISLVGGVGIIGVSLVELSDNQKGIFLRGGAKLYFTPDYWLEGMRRYNTFHGAYFSPVIVYSGFGFDYADQSGITQRGSNHSIALLLHLGKQWVISNSVTLDLFGGVGYGGSIINADGYGSSATTLDENSLVPYKFSHLQPDNQVPIAFDAGFSLGWLLP